MILQEIPNIQTAWTGSLQLLEQQILTNQVKIEVWLRQQFVKTPPPFYSSVDLRNAGFKLAPVDTNLFPAGFNNLNPDFMPLCIQAAQAWMEQYFPHCQCVLLIPESHTRNLNYLESVAVLQDILLKAGIEVRVGSLRHDLTGKTRFELTSGRSITLEPLTRQDTKVGVADFTACMVLLNHDLSEGIPDILQGIQQPIFPPLQMGWSQRTKSSHFGHYDQVAQEFAALITIDPWLINPLFRSCDEVDFMTRAGEDCLTKNVQSMYQDIQQKYASNQVHHKPYVVIKADAGTYGMGVMTLDDPAKLQQLNRKQRTRMSATKGGQKVSKVLIQEGVYTFETLGVEQAVAEPVVYMIGGHVVGGFYRVHTKRGANENLNAPGMHFEPLAIVTPCNSPDPNIDADSGLNRFYAYGVVARLALLAAARELAE